MRCLQPTDTVRVDFESGLASLSGEAGEQKKIASGVQRGGKRGEETDTLLAILKQMQTRSLLLQSLRWSQI